MGIFDLVRRDKSATDNTRAALKDVRTGNNPERAIETMVGAFRDIGLDGKASFSSAERVAQRALANAGNDADAAVDSVIRRHRRGITAGGRALTMWQTLRDMAPFLTEYSERAENDFSLTALMRSAVSECKAYSLTPEGLENIAAKLPADSVLCRKLHDLSLVLGAYSARLSEHWQDS